MTERYRYVFHIECPACKAKGAAYASEDDQPLDGISSFAIDSVPQGFSLVRTGGGLANSVISCTGCGRRAREAGGAQRATALQG